MPIFQKNTASFFSSGPGGPPSLLPRVRRGLRSWWGRWRPGRPAPEHSNLLPLLIEVLAGFSKVAGEALEEEIDSSLGFLRYDYPEAVYSELRKLYLQALREPQDLSEMAGKLAGKLDTERKMMLGVQLYDLISRAGLKQDHLVAYYSFMSELGMAAQAIDIVYQINAPDHPDADVFQGGSSPLESLVFGPPGTGDVALEEVAPGESLALFRYHELMLLKNRSRQTLVIRGRPVAPGELCRIYPGSRIVLGERVLTHQDLLFYFNVKKNLSRPTLFLVRDSDNEVRLERSRSRDAVLEIQFGLQVTLKALKPIQATVNRLALVPGQEVEAAIEDRIRFEDGAELSLLELRRRARSIGSRFPLKSGKSEYLVSNNPSLLGNDDILLSPGAGGDLLLRITCDYQQRTGLLTVLQADRPVTINGSPVRGEIPLRDGERIRLDAGQSLRCDFTDRIIEEERNIIRTLEAREISHTFGSGDPALEDINFQLRRGEMVCIMGSSGSGKSTLLRALAGRLQPTHGEVLLNGRPLYDHLEELKGYIAYVPQDDSFDEHLTIEENLRYAAAIRSPHLSRRERRRRLEGKLTELGLSERRDSVVGSPVRKLISGGERKRLNIGLDMIGNADVYLFDEPTSGLSSKDSEHVIEIIRNLSHNKITLVTIHQPSSRIFQMFNKAALIDKGGKLVFFGTPAEMLAYFAEAEHQQHFGTSLGACPSCGTTSPEFIFDVLETPLRDLSGDILFEENRKGQLIPARKFSPDYWRDKFETYRMMQGKVEVADAPAKEPLPPPPSPGNRRRVWREEWTQFHTLLRRAFKSKLRNRANFFFTLVIAPALAALIGTVLRYSEAGVYDFASSFHIPTYLFLSLIVAMFLGLTNSADDIIRDRAVLQRERNLNIRLPYYLTAKLLTLGLFALIQCCLYILIGNAILEIRGMFWIYLAYLFSTAMSGVALGLLISSLVSDAKTAANLIPMVLIPQIILGGALIKYEEMNRNLDLLHSFNRFFERHAPERIDERIHSDLEVPLICQFVPMRWSYEALVVAQARRNPLSRSLSATQKAIDKLAAKPDLSDQELDRLEDLKDLLNLLAGLERSTGREVNQALYEARKVLRGRLTLAESNLLADAGQRGISAEQLYINQKTADLVSKAEIEQRDYRDTRHLNVFFGPVKEYGAFRFDLAPFNNSVLNGSTLGILFLLGWILRRQLQRH